MSVDNKLFPAMVKISDISVESQIQYGGFSYIVTSVAICSFVAKRFSDGVDRVFTEKDLPNVTIKSPYTCGWFVAVTSEGIPVISPDEPKRDDLGGWTCPGYAEGEEYEQVTDIPWALFKVMTGRSFMTYADDPIQVYM